MSKSSDGAHLLNVFYYYKSLCQIKIDQEYFGGKDLQTDTPTYPKATFLDQVKTIIDLQRLIAVH